MIGPPSAAVYADSSALVKLIIDEAESDTLWSVLDGMTLVTSRIATVEVTRAVRLADEAALDECRRLLGSCTRVRISDAIIDRATALASGRLRSLDAIHLATALEAGLTRMAVYDHRLAQAAAAVGLVTIRPAPGDG